MNFDDRQYERVARWLDGESVELTEAERQLAAEIRAGEAALAGRLDVELPSAALVRTARRMSAAAAGSGRSAWWAAVGAAAAVAAALVVAVIIHQPTEQSAGLNLAAVQQTQVFVQSLDQSAQDTQLDVLANQMDELDAEIQYSLVILPGEQMDRRLDEMEQSINDFWPTDPWAELPEG